MISFLDGLSNDALKKEATTKAKSDTFFSIMKVCVCVCVCVCARTRRCAVCCMCTFIIFHVCTCIYSNNVHVHVCVFSTPVVSETPVSKGACSRGH